jgi:hypothetical protein
MKEKRLVRLFSMLLLLSISMVIYAQNETVTVTKTVEDTIDYNYQRKYEYLDKNLIEEKSLLKVGVKYILFTQSDLSPNYWSAGFLISYEQKLSPVFSFSSDVNYHVSYDTLSVVGLSLQGRYYYLKNKEIKNKTGADNMIGPYILFGIQDIISYSSPIYSSPIPKPSDKKKEFGFSPLIQLGIGNQFYINKWFNFDFNMYANYDVSDRRLGLQLEGKLVFVIRNKRNK